MQPAIAFPCTSEMERKPKSIEACRCKKFRFMKSINKNQTQLRAQFFGLLCVVAGVICFAQGFSHGSAAPADSQSTGERQDVSPPSVIGSILANPRFTSLTPRYSTKRIADIEIGEDVVSRDPQSGEVTTKRVANVFRRVSDHLRILKVRNPETDELQTIETTNEHPFWVTSRADWIKAKDLNIGDDLDDVGGGHAILELTEYESHSDGIPVFNFEVEDFHNYYVRAHGSRGPPVLVHNADGYDILQTQILNATPPGINGLPGTGRFGDGDEFVTFYHGTSPAGASSIRRNGIDLGIGERGTDFGQGFYLSTDRATAASAGTRLYGDAVEVVEFRITRSDLTQLQGLHFDSPSASWSDFTRFHKKYGPTELLHGGTPFDFVSGPMVRRIRSNGDVSHWDGLSQFSIHTDRATTIFNQGVQ